MSKSDLQRHGWPSSPPQGGWWDVKEIGGKHYVYRRWREMGRMRAVYVAPLDKRPLVWTNRPASPGPKRPGRWKRK